MYLKDVFKGYIQRMYSKDVFKGCIQRHYSKTLFKDCIKWCIKWCINCLDSISGQSLCKINNLLPIYALDDATYSLLFVTKVLLNFYEL